MISRQMTEMELHPEMETERPAEATVIPAEDLAEEIPEAAVLQQNKYIECQTNLLLGIDFRFKLA